MVRYNIVGSDSGVINISHMAIHNLIGVRVTLLVFFILIFYGVEVLASNCFFHFPLTYYLGRYLPTIPSP